MGGNTFIERLTTPQNEIGEKSAYADVYDLGPSVLKVISTPYVLADQPQENVDLLQERGIPYAQTVAFPMDLTDIGRDPYASVVLQEKLVESVEDAAAAGDGLSYVEEVVDVLDTGLENGVVIRDAKLDNFARFEDGLKLLDVSDEEVLKPYYADLSGEKAERFSTDCTAMYKELVRSAAEHLEKPREEIVDHISYVSRNIDEQQVPEDRYPETGLEYGLILDYTDVTASLPPAVDEKHPWEEAAELGLL